MTGPVLKILVVDDEPPIRRLLQTGLGTQGYAVVEAGNARNAVERIATHKPDLIVLDLGLPDRNGLELLREMRQGGIETPVVILSSRTDELGIVQALELGADDYVTKPFSMNELIARIKTALRHRLQVQGERPIFKIDDLSIDFVRRIVKMRDNEVRLSPREYEVLRVLVKHAGRVLTHESLLREVWGGSVDLQNLRVQIRQLRQKIEPDPEQPHYILTETGVGYRFISPE
jgi:two-component system, OmpR family, KDP operon response regulator KdpE